MLEVSQVVREQRIIVGRGRGKETVLERTDRKKLNTSIDDRNHETEEITYSSTV